MKVELSGDEIEIIAVALKNEARKKVMDTDFILRDDQILNAAKNITLANRLIDICEKERVSNE